MIKNIFHIIILLLLVSCTGNINNKTGKDLAKISLLNKEFDFGNINQSDSVSHDFVFKNTGENPLIIKSAKASCGCTIPRYTDNLILPGETGIIQVAFKPNKKQMGLIRNSVVINANTDSIFHVIYITANIIGL